MAELFNHPVCRYGEFVKLQELNRAVTSMSWGVKLQLTRGKSPRPNFAKWVYAPTAQEALDRALAFLVVKALNGG